MTINDLVDRWVGQTPDAPAVSDAHGTLSYAELGGWAQGLAAALREAGAGPESRVAVAMRRSSRQVVALLAVLNAGATYVPIDPDYPPQRSRFMLSDADATILVTDPDLAGAFPVDCPVLTVDRQPVPAPPPLPAPAVPGPGGGRGAYAIYTSGSTGVPKGVVVEHRHVVDLLAQDARLAVAPGDRVAQLAPTSFDASTFEIWAALCRGGTVVVLPGPQLSVRELGEQLRQHRPEWLFLTTGLFHLLVDFDPEVLAAVGTLITGGDVLSPEHIRTAAGMGRTAVYAAYGPTETTVFASLHRAEASTVPGRVPIGSPLSGKGMYVLDAELRRVPDGAIGEIYIGGHGIARGYHRRPGLTAERFLPDPYGTVPGARMYRTGDLGRCLPGGELEFHGRADRQVKVRGFRIELGEIEAVLAGNPQVSGAVARAVPAGGDKRLVAYLAARNGATLAVSELKAWVAQRLPSHAVPARYVVVDALPLDANGKFDRDALPDPWGSRSSIRGLPGYAAPRTELERTVAATWTEALELDQVGVHDNFFELGGDSLRSVSVLEQLRVYGFELTAGDFFASPTVAELAGLIERQYRQDPTAEPVRDQPVPVGSMPGSEG